MTYEEITNHMAKELAEAGEDMDAKIAIVERYEQEHPGIRAWFTRMIVRIAPILARQHELERQLGDLEERVMQIEHLVPSPTRH